MTKYYLQDNQRVIFLDELSSGIGPRYNIGAKVVIHNGLDEDRFCKAFEFVVCHADVFWLRFIFDRSELYQRFDESLINSCRAVQLQVLDLSDSPTSKEDAEAYIKEWVNQPFDIESPPLMRSYLIKLGEDKYYFVSIVHHLVMDGWGYRLFLEYLFGYYHGRTVSCEKIGSYENILKRSESVEKYFHMNQFFHN